MILTDGDHRLRVMRAVRLSPDPRHSRGRARAVRNPVLAYKGPGSHGSDMTITLHDGRAVGVRGVAGKVETTDGDATAVLPKAGPAVWVSWAGDPSEIERVRYIELATGQRVERKAVFSERIAGANGWDTIRIILSRIAAASTQLDYSEQDYSPLDYG